MRSTPNLVSVSEQDVKEQRSTDRSRYDTDRNACHAYRFRYAVGIQQEHASECCGGWYEVSVVGTDEYPHDVRCQKSDESDASGEAHRHGDRQCGDQENLDPGGIGIHSEGGSIRIAHG